MTAATRDTWLLTLSIAWTIAMVGALFVVSASLNANAESKPGPQRRSAAATTPAQRLNVSLRSFIPAVSAFPERVVRSACASSFNCSAFTRVTACTLALSPYIVTR